MIIRNLKDVRVGDVVVDYDAFMILSIEKNVVKWLSLKNLKTFKHTVPTPYEICWTVEARCDIIEQ